MKAAIFFLSLLGILQFCERALAYQIIAEDEVAFGYKDGEWTPDSHRYQTIYSVNESEGTIIEEQIKDMATGETWKGSTYQILDKAQLPMFTQGNPLKAIRINPKVSKVEVITFNRGKYIWTKNSDDYVNVFSGSYLIDF